MNEVYFLEQIAEKKRQLYSEQDEESAVEHFYEWAVERGHVPKDLAKALDRTNGIKLIAELKRPSPYSGDTVTDFEPREIAIEYVGSGASAISVITEEDHFRGSLHCLRFVRQGIDAPILRNGFIIFPWEIWESKAYGADAVVITASILSEEEIEKLIETAGEAGLQTLIDINSPG
ncbi:MAG: indole-3-glycerol phosphate synthase, partial [Chloroflexi bacterium]|nr:indole-3-glycerol phosphate synthase [Chloroflexota bacterium]